MSERKAKLKATYMWLFYVIEFWDSALMCVRTMLEDMRSEIWFDAQGLTCDPGLYEPTKHSAACINMGVYGRDFKITSWLGLSLSPNSDL